MKKPDTTATRVANHATRMKAKGFVKVSVSAWVPKRKADACRAAAKAAITEAIDKSG